MACAIVSGASWTISAMNPDRRELDDALYGRRTGSLMPQVRWSAVTEHVGWVFKWLFGHSLERGRCPVIPVRRSGGFVPL
jgi:hypothetical protein